jgi:hypothetical protein
MKWRSCFWMAILAAALAISCADDGSRPGRGASPEFARIDSPAPETQDLPSADATVPRQLPIEGEPETCISLSPSTGGTLELGRYRLIIPPHALDAPTVVTMAAREADGHIGCELQPHGIQFRVPVILSMDLTGTNLADCADATIYWLDENSGTWIDMRGEYDPVTETVTISTSHFSQFRAGRAGW